MTERLLRGLHRAEERLLAALLGVLLLLSVLQIALRIFFDTGLEWAEPVSRMGVLWLALLVGVLQFIFQDTGTQVPYTGFSRGLVTGMRTSLLLPWFSSVLWGLAASLRFFIPKNADIFEVVLQQILGTTGG